MAHARAPGDDRKGVVGAGEDGGAREIGSGRVDPQRLLGVEDDGVLVAGGERRDAAPAVGDADRAGVAADGDLGPVLKTHDGEPLRSRGGLDHEVVRVPRVLGEQQRAVGGGAEGRGVGLVLVGGDRRVGFQQEGEVRHPGGLLVLPCLGGRAVELEDVGAQRRDRGRLDQASVRRVESRGGGEGVGVGGDDTSAAAAP